MIAIGEYLREKVVDVKSREIWRQAQETASEIPCRFVQIGQLAVRQAVIDTLSRLSIIQFLAKEFPLYRTKNVCFLPS